MLRYVLGLATLGIILGVAGRAEAGFLSRPIEVENRVEDDGFVLEVGNHFATVGAGVEFPGFLFGSFDIDVSDARIRLFNFVPTYYNEFDFNGLIFKDYTGTIDTITGVTINPLSNIAGFTAADVTFNANRITVNLSDLNVIRASQIVLDVTFASPPAAAVSEPASVTLLATGVLGLGGYGWRHRKAAAA